MTCNCWPGEPPNDLCEEHGIAAEVERMLDKAVEKTLRERDKLHAALQYIADSGCTCKGYYRCGNCVDRLVTIAQEALDNTMFPRVEVRLFCGTCHTAIAENERCHCGAGGVRSQVRWVL